MPTDHPCEGATWTLIALCCGVAITGRFCRKCGYEARTITDPVHQHRDGTWWFIGETWADENGPYDTEEQANQLLALYCLTCLGTGDSIGYIPLPHYRPC